MRVRSIGWFFLMLLSTLIVLIASRYLRLNPADFFAEQREVFVRRETALFAHVAGAMTALLVGPWQFVAWVRRRSIRIHRTLGVVYAGGCLVGGTAGVSLATTAHGGVVASLGFAGLGCSWLATTSLALYAIYRGQVDKHWRWMVRSFALCFAAVTLRLYLGVYSRLDALGWAGPVTFTTAYVAISWLCWVPNLAIAWRISGRRAEIAKPPVAPAI